MIDKDLLDLFKKYQGHMGQMQLTASGLLTVAHVLKGIALEVRLLRKTLGDAIEDTKHPAKDLGKDEAGAPLSGGGLAGEGSLP